MKSVLKHEVPLVPPPQSYKGVFFDGRLPSAFRLVRRWFTSLINFWCAAQEQGGKQFLFDCQVRLFRLKEFGIPTFDRNLFQTSETPWSVWDLSAGRTAACTLRSKKVRGFLKF